MRNLTEHASKPTGGSGSGTACWQAGPELIIANAADSRAALLQALAAETAPAPALDLSRVTDFDSAGLQLLLATRRQLQDQGRSLTLSHASPAVRQALSLLGLDALLT